MHRVNQCTWVLRFFPLNFWLRDNSTQGVSNDYGLMLSHILCMHDRRDYICFCQYKRSILNHSFFPSSSSMWEHTIELWKSALLDLFHWSNCMILGNWHVYHSPIRYLATQALIPLLLMPHHLISKHMLFFVTVSPVVLSSL